MKTITKMYEAGNHLLVCAEYSDPELHSHSAAHIMISLDDEIEIITKDKKKKCKGAVIPSGMVHTANTNANRVLVFLFDNTTSVANQIQELRIIEDVAVEEIARAYANFETCDKTEAGYSNFAKCVYDCINIEVTETTITDHRIQEAIAYMHSKLQEGISCEEVASYIFLSEGRFSHLFREQIGMTFSAYLIYQRVMKAYTGIINGKSITDAALDAGFSSSAHFAEINKRLFGLSASIVKKDLEFHKIAEI